MFLDFDNSNFVPGDVAFIFWSLSQMVTFERSGSPASYSMHETCSLPNRFLESKPADHSCSKQTRRKATFQWYENRCCRQIIRKQKEEFQPCFGGSMYMCKPDFPPNPFPQVLTLILTTILTLALNLT